MNKGRVLNKDRGCFALRLSEMGRGPSVSPQRILVDDRPMYRSLGSCFVWWGRGRSYIRRMAGWLRRITVWFGQDGAEGISWFTTAAAFRGHPSSWFTTAACL